MPRSHWKDIPVQLGLTAESLKKLRQIVLDVEDRIEHEGVLKHGQIMHWATYHLLAADGEEVLRVLKAGKTCQEAYETRAERLAEEAVQEEPTPPESVPPESVPQEPEKKAESLPVSKTTATVWTRGKKPRKGDGKGLDSERPTGRKMRKSPPRK